MKRGDQGEMPARRSSRGVGNVVEATSAAHRTPVHDAERSFCEIGGMVDGIRE